MRLTLFLVGSIFAVGAAAQDTAEWQQMRTLGRTAFEHGRYSEAEPMLTQALVLAQQLPSGDQRVITSLRDLADVHRANGRQQQAEELLRAALILREKEAGPAALSLRPDIDALAWTLYAQGKLQAASDQFRRSLAILDASGSPEPAGLITALLNLARVCQPLKLDTETVALLERIIHTREQWKGEFSAEVAGDHMRLGRHHGAQKRPAEAEQEFLRALAILEKVNGPMHASLTGPLDELGSLYASQKRFEDAEPHLRRAVTVREWANGPLATELAPALENLAGVWVELKHLPQAEEAYRTALALWEMKMGPDSALLGNTLDRLASVCAAEQKFDLAETYFRKALAIREKDQVANLINVALVLGAQEKKADAEPYYKVALTVLEKPTPAPKTADPDLLRATLENYRDLLQSMGQRSAAARLTARLKTLEAKARPE